MTCRPLWCARLAVALALAFCEGGHATSWPPGGLPAALSLSERRNRAVDGPAPLAAGGALATIALVRRGGALPLRPHYHAKRIAAWRRWSVPTWLRPRNSFQLHAGAVPRARAAKKAGDADAAVLWRL